MCLRCYLLFLFFIPFFDVKSQTSPFLNDIVDPNQQNVSLIYGNNKNINGHPFWNENYNIGTVYLVERPEIENIQLKYDILNDQLLTKSSSKEVSLQKRYLLGFKIYLSEDESYHTFVKRSIFGNEYYFEVLTHSDSIYLLKKHEKEIVKGQQPVGYNSGELTKDKIVKKERIYLKKGAGNLIELSKLKKDLVPALAGSDRDIEEKLEDFVKENRIKFRDENELMTVFEKYEKLINPNSQVTQ